MRRRLTLAVLLAGVVASVTLLAQPAVNFLNARVSLDSNGALLVAMNGYGGTTGPATTVGNTRVKLDANGALVTTLGGAAGTITVPAIATTSTDGLVIQNTTAATGGATVQMSPRTKWCGTAWNSSGSASEIDCWIAEVLPVTAAGTTTSQFNIARSINGGAYTTILSLTSAGNANFTNNMFANNVGAIGWTGRTTFNSTADKLMQILDTGQTTGTELNGGTPTLGTCTAGALVSGSHNSAGSYTSNTSGSCVINFGTPNFTNTPFCFAMSTASTTHPRISASSASSITVTGGVSGETIQYFCIGRIGT